MTPDEFETLLSRARHLTKAARERLDAVAEHARDLRRLIEATTSPAREEAGSAKHATLEHHEKAGNGTPAPRTAQVEVVSK